MYEALSHFVCLILFTEVSHMTSLVLISVSAASRSPKPVLRTNSFSITM
jgi:hypothetical protein